jgi:hypothetical protein
VLLTRQRRFLQPESGVPFGERSGDLPTVAEILSQAEAAWLSSPALVAVTWGPAHLLVIQNETSCRLVGRRDLGQPMHIAFPGTRPTPLANLDRTLATGQTTEVRHAAGGFLMSPVRS